MKKENAVNKKFTKGFTLLESLVVVLIIGVLAAIALPQYKLIVGRSKFNTIKEMTRAIAESAERFYLVQNRYPSSYKELDIEVPGFYYEMNRDTLFSINGTNIYCLLDFGNEKYVYCTKTIFGTEFRYHQYFNNAAEGNRNIRYCMLYAESAQGQLNKICRNDVNDNSKRVICNGSFCIYYYNKNK